jgi:hypothetical protein
MALLYAKKACRSGLSKDKKKSLREQATFLQPQHIRRRANPSVLAFFTPAFSGLAGAFPYPPAYQRRGPYAARHQQEKAPRPLAVPHRHRYSPSSVQKS